MLQVDLLTKQAVIIQLLSAVAILQVVLMVMRLMRNIQLSLADTEIQQVMGLILILAYILSLWQGIKTIPKAMQLWLLVVCKTMLMVLAE